MEQTICSICKEIPTNHVCGIVSPSSLVPKRGDVPKAAAQLCHAYEVRGYRQPNARGSSKVAVNQKMA